MKKTTAIILSVLIFMSVVYTAFAANTPNRIYADAVTAESGETVTVPVKIQNNEGFMGFAVYVTYDADVFTPVSVSKGTMLSGMFNDSIATSINNSFKVVYTGTGNITADGTLFNVVFDVADEVPGKYEIELTYSQQDTFNENWGNVVFACEDIEVIVIENGTTATTSEQPTTVTSTESTTQKQETTTQITTTEPSTTEPVTTEPSVDETTTQPATEPSTEPENEEKLLSVRMREWVNGLPFPLNIILGFFVIPITFIISVFE